MKACNKLVKEALKQDMSVSVFDGEEWSLKRSTSFKAITAEIKAVEEAQLRFYDAEGKSTGWALVSVYGLEDDETVIDSTMEAWIDLALEA